MQRGRTGNCAREIACGDFDGQETVGNSLGRAPWEWSGHAAWTDKKPWEIRERACSVEEGNHGNKGRLRREGRRQDPLNYTGSGMPVALRIFFARSKVPTEV